jgi:hypothetical protein
MLAVTMCSGCNAGVAAVSSKAGSSFCYVTGVAAALHNYLGHTVTAMSYVAGSTQLTLHLQSPLAAAAAAAAAQHAAEQAAAAVDTADTWQVHQVRHVLRNLQTAAGLSILCFTISADLQPV